MTLTDSGHVTSSVVWGFVCSVSRNLRRNPEERKLEVRFGIVRDRKKRFFEVTLVGSGHVTCSAVRGTETELFWCHEES